MATSSFDTTFRINPDWGVKILKIPSRIMKSLVQSRQNILASPFRNQQKKWLRIS